MYSHKTMDYDNKKSDMKRVYPTHACSIVLVFSPMDGPLILLQKQ